jgi:transcriptional regulator with XRE-family HTH domain
MNQLHDRPASGSQLPATSCRFISVTAGACFSGMGIGKRLKDLRESKGLTQSQLEHASGVAVRTIRGIENGLTTNPNTSTVKLLAAVLEVSPEQLLGDEPAERPAPRSREKPAGPRSAREAVANSGHYLQYLFKRAGIVEADEQLAAAAALDKRIPDFSEVTPALVDLWLESYVREPSRTSRKTGARAGR